MSKPPRPSYPPSDHSHRHRAPSLSIARSPAVLSSSSFTSPPLHTDHDHPSSSSSSHPFFHPSGPTHPQPTSGLTRTLSRPKPTLSDIPSEEEIPLKPMDNQIHTKTVIFDNASEGGSDISAGFEDGEDIDLVSESGGRMRYDGEFQPPDSRELIGIGLSIAGVSVLALAAGLTTVLNWVL